MNRILLVIGSLLCNGWINTSYAATAPTLVLQVPETFYQHPVRLLHPYQMYWHNRAEAAEKAGLSAFQAQNYSTASCEADAQGQALVVIEPNMFYNPQMGVFHTEITAKVYNQPGADSALGKPLMTVKGQGQSRGWVTYNVDHFASKSYQQAFEQVIQQLQSNPVFEQTIAQTPLQSYQALCTSIDTITQPKLFF